MPNNTDNFIYPEMMAHTALFTHKNPKKVAILGESSAILDEVIKHKNIDEIHHVTDKKITHSTRDQRIHLHTGEIKKWLEKSKDNHFDVMIVATDISQELLQLCFNALHSESIFIQESHSPLQPELNTFYQNLLTIGFRDVQMLHFPQPDFPTGWRMAWMATKLSVFRRISEKDVYNKKFDTHYYNFDVHKASLALPEFIRKELNKETP
jgi:spermidine synthase